MAAQRFQVWFGTRPADADQLRRIEEIEVTQEMDAFWEARLRMVLCLDAKGSWLHWPGDTCKPFSRVRVEIDVGDGRFVPLIDGPLVSVDADLDAQPGRSTATMVVRDDSAFLDRDEEVDPTFEHRSAGAIATDIFHRFKDVIRATDIDATRGEPETTTRRGTALQFLRELGRLNDRHAYVLPGAKPGSSIGCFKADPKTPSALPPLVMIGAGRNLSGATIMQDPQGGERTSAQVLRVSDQGITTLQSSAQAQGLMRELPARPADLTPRRLLHPADNTLEDPQAAAAAQARRNGYVYQLRSHVIPGCYGAVLTPYQKVRVEAGQTPYSGDYLITQVTHRITPSMYAQELEAKTDSVTELSGAAVAEALGGGLQLTVSLNGGIF